MDGGPIVQPLSRGRLAHTSSPDGRGLLVPVDRYEAKYGSGLSSTLSAVTQPPATDRRVG